MRAWSDFDLLDLPRSKSSAKRQASPYYYTGRPCSRGHDSVRETTAGCCQCAKERKRRRYAQDTDYRARILAYIRQPQVMADKNIRRRLDPVKKARNAALRQSARKSTEQRKQCESAQKSKRYANDPEYRAHIKRRNAEWHKNNGAKAAARMARRRANKSTATPAWLTQSMLKQIRAFYTEARRMTTVTGEPHNVDHIVPIKGKTVCGLHVPWNLRVTTRLENYRKNNRLPDDASEHIAIQLPLDVRP